MQVDHRIHGDVVVVTVHGEISLDKGSDLTLRAKIRSLVQQGHPRLLLDLRDVPYVDSAGLGELTYAYVTVKRTGGELKLLRPAKQLRDLLATTKLARVFETYDDDAAAVASFAPPSI